MNAIFNAISHPDRRHILRLLKEHGELSAGDVASHFDVSKPTMSHHLKQLTTAELLDREKRGQHVFYRINLSVFEETMQVMFDLFSVGAERTPRSSSTAAEPSPDDEDRHRARKGDVS